MGVGGNLLLPRWLIAVLRLRRRLPLLRRLHERLARIGLLLTLLIIGVGHRVSGISGVVLLGGYRRQES